MNKTLIYASLLGILIPLLVFAIVQSETVMYPTSSAREGFLQIFLLGLAVALVICYLILRYTNTSPLNSKYLSIFLFLAMVGVMILGIYVGFDVKAEEFLLYFLLIHFSGMLLAMLLLVVLYTATQLKALLLSLGGGLVIGFLGVLFGNMLGIPVNMSIYISVFLVFLMVFFSIGAQEKIV